MTPTDLIATTHKILGRSVRQRPRQSDLKRAMSTAYYAVFHQLCWNAADTLIGGKNADRSTPAWQQTYRAMDHRVAKQQCSNSITISLFPQEAQDIANLFVELQVSRHEADYDPLHRLTRSEVITAINRVEDVIRNFKKLPIKDRRAFAAWTVLKRR